VYSQHTQRFIELTKVLKKTESKTDTIFYRNGKPHFVNVRSTYEFDGGIAKNYTGKSNVYYRNGNIARETIQDDFGNYLNVKLFDKKGNLIQERITTEIDNRAENIDDYLEFKKFGDFKKTINYYKYSRKTKKWYKYKEEFLSLTENQFTEIRNILDEYGQIIRTKTRSYEE
tara:strand:+ start:100 stop:615 length:516 start_codon:yes stop_codon:yes gene_type:complete